MLKPCLDCGTPSPKSRCPECFRKIEGGRVRPHYSGDYAARAAAVRATAETCWVCGQNERAGDPWQADHVIPGDPSSPLLPAHRSCNIARSNKARTKPR